MPVLAHPGPSSPPPPRVRLDADDTWSALPAEDGLLRAEAPGSASDPVAVAVRHHVGPAALGSDDLAGTLAGRAASGAGREDGQVEEPFVVELGGRDWHARNVSWVDAGTDVVEVVLVTSLGGDDVASRHLVAIGRVRGAGLDADYDVLQSVLETLVVETDG
ncbi:hypothetical protein KC207_04860 [Phycicoccus sp. BSK3Z-2]|uniref:Uncharacterized protein n=1 Tax=Phycicoccus avicenniae TaxID=2828860 RepID=A0A941D700_9MICO|nr:hypothetical protein [Phycicoccus avicenniae]MBR7742616.1 hypothetical protein [Phycicoccus avicenniae]